MGCFALASLRVFFLFLYLHANLDPRFISIPNYLIACSKALFITLLSKVIFLKLFTGGSASAQRFQGFGAQQHKSPRLKFASSSTMSFGTAIGGRVHNLDDTSFTSSPENPVVRSAKFVYEASHRRLHKLFNKYLP